MHDIRLDEFGDSELLQLWKLKPLGDKARRAIEYAVAHGDLVVLQEEACAAYWRRQLDEIATMTDAMISQILQLPQQSAGRGILGEAASRGKLTTQQVGLLMARLSKDEWSYDQVVARSLVFSYVDTSRGAPESRPDFERTVRGLCDLRTTWAIVELLPFFSVDELRDLESRLRARNVLTRYDRHCLREAICGEMVARGVVSRRGRWGPA